MGRWRNLCSSAKIWTIMNTGLNITTALEFLTASYSWCTMWEHTMAFFFLSRSILLDKFRELKGRLARQNTSNVCCTYVFNLKVFNQFTSLQSDPPACGWNPKMWVILQSSIFICIRLSCNTIFCEIETRHFFNNYSNQATMCTSLKKKIQINTCLCQRTRWIDAKTWLQWCKVATKRWILNDLFIRNNIIVKTF